MPKTAYVIKIDNVRGTESIEGVKNYGGIYPFAYLSKEKAIEKATALDSADLSKFGQTVRQFEITSVQIGDKSFAKLVAAKSEDKDADVPLFLLRLSAGGVQEDNIKLYGGVYPWAYADENAACDKMDALDNEVDCDTRIIVRWGLRGLSGLKDFVTSRPAPAPAPAPTSRCSSGCSCQQTVAGTLSGTTSSGGRVTGAFVGVIEGGE